MTAIASLSNPLCYSSKCANPSAEFEKPPIKLQVRTWEDALPMIGIIAAGCIFSSSFALGAAVGTVLTCATLATFVALKAINVLKEDGTSDYLKDMDDLSPIHPCVTFPVIEELLCRVGIQEGIGLFARTVLPAATVTLCGYPLALASVVTVVASAAIFGLLHLTTNNPDREFQATYCTVHGLFMGAMKNTYGLLAPIGHHVVTNTLFWSFYKFYYFKNK